MYLIQLFVHHVTVQPGQVRNIKVVTITWKSAEIHWDTPLNVEQEGPDAGGVDMIYKLKYCQINNETEPTCKHRPSMREKSITLEDLESSMDYRVSIVGINQRVEGESASYEFKTAKHVPKPEGLLVFSKIVLEIYRALY